MTTTDQNEPSEARASLSQQVADLRTEGEELSMLLSSLDARNWDRTTGFKDWTIYDVVAHLHFSDHMGVTTMRSSDAFHDLMADVSASGLAMADYTRRWLGDISAAQLLSRWCELFADMCDRLAAMDPDERLTWAGPGMKPRMFTTARQMETWAHGWEIYDLLGTPRRHTDRIKNIATIGVRTFGWTFINRKLDVPADVPYVRLTAPSGAIWEFDASNASNRVSGTAVEFCQVVTQVRNIADTSLEVIGESATAWMAIAQCFAGAPAEPPAPGTRIGHTG
ncbi:MAG: TIGR03084 family metal-binding protein [Gammaproteobacteria bacterium]|nr:TIGR03084 family metal-binding protein [Gammaproteobacteria bacterium]